MSEAENKIVNFQNVEITEQMEDSYLDYAMSVIVSRALPDVRDGLKPVHRRILYAMWEMGVTHDKQHKKSARVVGDVMGKYHPHGDSAIYGAVVRMAQSFSLRMTLVNGQGNFGSVDGDPPAQMRYTEVKLEKISTEAMLRDIDMDTVDFQDNYDGTESEPRVLPSRFPNLLVNGANGIAVGMATNIPTHNLVDVLDACIAYIENPDITAIEVARIIKAPDFPTGGIIMGSQKPLNALVNGRGSVPIRAKTNIEDIGGKAGIVVTELPYQVNKSDLINRIIDLIRNKELDGITDIRDESNKLGIRLVVELRKDVVPDVILNKLFKMTELQTSFAYNMLAIDRGRPVLMSALDVIRCFIDFRKEVIKRRLEYLLNKVRTRAHLLIGLYLAVINIDEVISIIRGSADPAEAKGKLLGRKWQAGLVITFLNLIDDYRNKIESEHCFFTEEQVKAILEMRLQRLTALEEGKIKAELNESAESIINYLDVLSSKEKMVQIIVDECEDIKKTYGSERITSLEELDHEVNIEDLIQREDVVVTVTSEGYIKRVPLSTYRSQKRGGKGRSATSMHDDDALRDVIVVNTHDTLLFFTDMGKVYRIKVYKLPVGSPTTKGRALVNLLEMSQEERVTTIMPLPQDESTWPNLFIVFATSSGGIRKNVLSAFTIINSSGKKAMELDEGDKLISVKVCSDEDHIFLYSKMGRAIRFPVSSIRTFQSRSSSGIRGMNLDESDEVMGMTILLGAEVAIEVRQMYMKIPYQERSAGVIDEAYVVHPLNQELIKKMSSEEQFILTITVDGFGKRTSAYEYRITKRGGVGICNIETKIGVASSFIATQDDEIIVITNKGTLIRTKVGNIRITGRQAKGVRIIDLQKDEQVKSVTLISAELDEAFEEQDNALAEV